ncbi:MAG: peptidoglycan DD-metalloendopeptidase family protein [Rhodoferax sp.]|nr:peptidoglycan DD-metalloendopeptidase family protein [Rhodoferax sp.]
MMGVRMKHGVSRGVSWALLAVAAWWLTACGSVSLNRAPVEDRMVKSPAPVPPVTAGAEGGGVKPSPGFENAGTAGYYTVKPGDTLIRIALEHGQSFRDLASWNQLDNPNRIEVGQVLRVIAPLSAEVIGKPIPKAVVAASPVSAVASANAPAAPVPLAPATLPEASSANQWIWPVSGAVVAGFDEIKNKGVDLAGKDGDPVLAVADGRVVYVGAGLRGYGNLIILKHDNVYLTAYAHNRTLLVKEDQAVLKGQKIAEMGNSDAERVKLHFEVRRQGKPVDPVKYLPPR